MEPVEHKSAFGSQDINSSFYPLSSISHYIYFLYILFFIDRIYVVHYFLPKLLVVAIHTSEAMFVNELVPFTLRSFLLYPIKHIDQFWHNCIVLVSILVFFQFRNYIWNIKFMYFLHNSLFTYYVVCCCSLLPTKPIAHIHSVFYELYADIFTLSHVTGYSKCLISQIFALS